MLEYSAKTIKNLSHYSNSYRLHCISMPAPFSVYTGLLYPHMHIAEVLATYTILYTSANTETEQKLRDLAYWPGSHRPPALYTDNVFIFYLKTPVSKEKNQLVCAS